MQLSITSSNEYQRQYDKLKRSGRLLLVKKLNATIQLIATGQPLPPGYRNHKLKGPLADFYECHIEPDWLLIYEIEKHKLILMLTATGTHSQLFGD